MAVEVAVSEQPKRTASAELLQAIPTLCPWSTTQLVMAVHRTTIWLHSQEHTWIVSPAVLMDRKDITFLEHSFCHLPWSRAGLGLRTRYAQWWVVHSQPWAARQMCPFGRAHGKRSVVASRTRQTDSLISTPVSMARFILGDWLFSNYNEDWIQMLYTIEATRKIDCLAYDRIKSQHFVW